MVRFVSTHHQLSLELIGELILGTTGPHVIRDDDWDEFVAGIDHMGDFQVRGLLQYSPLQAPNGGQRRRVKPANDRIEAAGLLRVAICTESTFARGAMTALNWVARRPAELRAFRPKDAGRALLWLAEVAKFDMSEATAALRRATHTTGARYDAASISTRTQRGAQPPE